MATLDQNKTLVSRLLLLGLFFAAGLVALVVRLWFVQVYEHRSMTQEVSTQSIRRIRLLPVRGRMLDRRGRVLVDNNPSYDVVFHVSEMRQPGARQNTVEHILRVSERIADMIGRDMPFNEDYVARRLRVYPALPMPVFNRLGSAELAKIAEMLPPVGGMEVIPNFDREYCFPGTASHVLGFTGRREPKEAGLDRFSYVPLELRGRTGLEAEYDGELSGRGGMRVVRVDTLGYVHDQIGEARPPKNGSDLILTVDLRAQLIAEKLLHGYRGAIVVVDVRRGALLAMASSPGYDLTRMSTDYYGLLLSDEDNRPLVNRALSAGYMPGSIVKPLVAMAGLECGAITPDSTYYCDGTFRFGDARISCWDRNGHGTVDVVKAIEQSCNPFFLHYGLETGLENLRPMFLGAGLGTTPKIDLPIGWGAGLVPSREWARKRLGREWLAIDTIFVSIGQGNLTLSPLQAAMYAAAVANGGTVFRPYLVQRVIDPDGYIRRNTPPVAERRLPVSRENLDIVRSGMYWVVNRGNGTGKRARNSAIVLAGKTGTAEVIRPDERYNNTWFIGFGPFEDPKYAIAVLVEHGVSGGRTAAPLAGRFFEQWLGTDLGGAF